MDIVRIFVDANIFIEMKDLSSVNWRDLFPQAEEVRILVSMHVVKELDKLKNDRIERRRKRARLALQLIDEASQLNEKILREDPYRLTLETVFPRAHHWDDYHILDQNDPDDRLVAHVIEEGGSILFSDDSGPRIKASKYGVTAVQPPSSFRLPPEESPEQKKVRELSERIRTLEDNRPRMMLKLGCPSDPIVLERPLLGPMPDDLQADLVKRILDLHPKLKKPAENSAAAVLGVRKANVVDWARYEVGYDNFVEKVKRHAAEIHIKLNAIPLSLEVPFEVVNIGRVTLTNADVAIRLQGEARLHVHEEDTDQNEDQDDLDRFDLEFPDPPQLGESNQSPRVRFGRRPWMALQHIRYPGAVTFQWDIVPDEENPRRANLSNNEFRVGKSHADKIAIVPEGTLPLDLSLTFDLEARDLDEPVTKEFRVRIEMVDREWTFDDFERVESVLPAASAAFL
ncbi:hypothetical protein RHSP_40861 (plasmid) [Rhizobium freirei PRF 81]|uniref:PIN domain-containing protein n=1 Tax=Rhizobium freirei PRF 81 TaxID=363754 RepID=N6UPT2_9HYPH|nr:PIN domain-containing protein [Rhizobium freirei]ENN83770.1 hypothetical protein RHSP_40861 [Rhizobium freirei PRF 81]